MHARIGTFEASRERLDEVLAFFRDRVVTAFSEHAGFLGYQAYVDRERGRILGISRWATRSALDASADTARRALAEAAALGASVVSEPQIMELGFDSAGGDGPA